MNMLSWFEIPLLQCLSKLQPKRCHPQPSCKENPVKVTYGLIERGDIFVIVQLP